MQILGREILNDEEMAIKSRARTVTVAEVAYAAISMLTKGTERFGIVILNVHSPDFLSFMLLSQAANLGIVSICLCDEPVNPLLARRPFDNGAYLYMRKPLSQIIMKEMWQLVVRVRHQKGRDQIPTENIIEVNSVVIGDDENNHYTIFGDEKQGENNIPNEEDVSKVAVNNNVSNKKYEVRRSNRGKQMCGCLGKRKGYTIWTSELHAKFVKAASLLGEGRCYPKGIVELMNVPGLTKNKVASHLQKCRKNKWKPLDARRSRQPKGQYRSSDPQRRSIYKRHGSMPVQETNLVHDQHNYGSTRSPFNDPFLAQNFSWPQQQPFTMVEPQDPTIESSNNRTSLAISEDHVQGDFNMNVNASHVSIFRCE